MGQRAFAGVDQQHDAVDNFESAFYFAAEIAVAGGIDNVDFGAVIAHAGGFGENRDAAFALQIVRIHDAFGDSFVGPKDATLSQKCVYKSCFSVVNVRDNSDVAGVA